MLASHGLRSRITGAPEGEPLPVEDTPEPTTQPEAATGEAADVEKQDDGDVAESFSTPEVPSIPPPPAVAPPAGPPPTVPPEPVDGDARFEEEADSPALHRPAASELPAGALASIIVEEWSDRVEVTATAGDGRTVTQRSDATEAGMFAAVVAAVGTLAEGTPPRLLSVTPIEANGSEALAVVVRREDGTTLAGAAVVRVGAGYAVGRAAWAALHST